MEPKNQIESELNSALRNIYSMRKSRSAHHFMPSAGALLPVKQPVHFLTDEMTSHRVPLARTSFHLAESRIAVKNDLHIRPAALT
jgi:hypothetical protein